MKQSAYLITLLVLLVTFSGCGGTNFGPMGSVNGKLTMDGEPMPSGTQLMFMQIEAGYAAFANTDAEGNYDLRWMREGKTFSEVPVGEYKVLIQPPPAQDVEELSAEEMLEGGDNDIKFTEPIFAKKYQQHATSGLSCVVAEGENTCDLDLKSE